MYLNDVTDDGISMDVKDSQFLKQYSPNDVTDDGNMMEVKEEQ